MLKILMICTSGISTNLLIGKMKEAASEKHINAYIWAVSEAEMDEQIPKADIILLGPQSRFLQSKAEALADTKPVLLIDLMAYSTMNGAVVFDAVMEYFKSDI